MANYDWYITPEEYVLAEKNGVNKRNLDARIRACGWDKEKAINTPVQRKRKYPKKYINLAKSNGISTSCFAHRVKLGWSLERAATKPIANLNERLKELHEKNRKYSKQYVELANSNGISESLFYLRIRKGWDLETASIRPPMTRKEIGLLTKEKRSKGLNLIFTHSKVRKSVY